MSVAPAILDFYRVIRGFLFRSSIPKLAGAVDCLLVYDRTDVEIHTTCSDFDGATSIILIFRSIRGIYRMTDLTETWILTYGGTRMAISTSSNLVELRTCATWVQYESHGFELRIPAAGKATNYSLTVRKIEECYRSSRFYLFDAGGKFSRREDHISGCLIEIVYKSSESIRPGREPTVPHPFTAFTRLCARVHLFYGLRSLFCLL